MLLKIYGENKKTKEVEIIGEIEIIFKDIKPHKVNELCTTIYNVLFWDSWMSSCPESLLLHKNPRYYRKESIRMYGDNENVYIYNKSKKVWDLEIDSETIEFETTEVEVN